MKLGPFETVVFCLSFSLLLSLVVEVHVNGRNAGGGWIAQSVTHTFIAVAGYSTVSFAMRVWRLLFGNGKS